MYWSLVYHCCYYYFVFKKKMKFLVERNHLLHLLLRHLVARWANIPSFNSNVAVLGQSQWYFYVLVHSSDQCHLFGRQSSCSDQPEWFWEWECIVGCRLWLHQGLGIESSVLFLSLSITEISYAKSFSSTSDFRCKSLHQTFLMYFFFFLMFFRTTCQHLWCKRTWTVRPESFSPSTTQTLTCFTLLERFVSRSNKHKSKSYTFSFQALT